MNFKDNELYWFFRRLKFKIEMAFDSFRGRCQRFMRGYSYGDVWSMDCWFIRTVKPMLVHLRDNHMGVPLEFANNPDGWTDVLDEMINCLTLMDEDNIYEVIGFGGELDFLDMTIEDYNKMNQIRDENKARFFALFSKYFYNLWD